MGCSFAKVQDSVLKQQHASNLVAHRSLVTAYGGSRRQNKEVSNAAASVDSKRGEHYITSRSETDMGRLAAVACSDGRRGPSGEQEKWDTRNGHAQKQRSQSASDFRTVTSVCGNSTLRICLSDDGMMLVVERSSVGETPDVAEEDEELDYIDDETLLQLGQVNIAAGRRNLSADAEPEDWQALQRYRRPAETEGESTTNSVYSDEVYEPLRHTCSPANAIPVTIAVNSNNHGNESTADRCHSVASTSITAITAARHDEFTAMHGCGCATSSSNRLMDNRRLHYLPNESFACTSSCQCCGGYDSGPMMLRNSTIHGSLLNIMQHHGCCSVDDHNYYDEISPMTPFDMDNDDCVSYESPNYTPEHVLEMRRHCNIRGTTDLIPPRSNGVGERFQVTAEIADPQYVMTEYPSDMYDQCNVSRVIKPLDKDKGKNQRMGTPVSGIISYYPNWDGESDCCSSNASTPYVVFLPRQQAQ